jgi:DNA-directed RNA polymerase subunit RPC12/RpoP
MIGINVAVIVQKCASCGKTVNAEVDQTAIDGKLRWYISYRCPSCNAAAESDDIGFPPEDIRALLIEHDGLWDLYVDDISNKMEVMRLLRSLLGWSLTEASRRLRDITKPVYSGSKVEVEWLARSLSGHNISISFVSRESM